MAPSNKLCFDSLSDDIIVEILQRFPQDIVHRYKCVSKRWLNVIMSESFITSYRRYHTCLLNSKPSFALFYGKEKFSLLFSKKRYCSAFSENPLFHTSGFSFDFLFSYILLPSCDLVSSSNGLVLVRSTYDHYYVVCNPLTKQRVTIPIRSKREHIGFICKPTSAGCSFRIVQFSWEKNAQVFEVYDSEMKQWTKPAVCDKGYLSIHNNNYLDKKAIVCNGLLHWKYERGYILVYDPFNTSDKCRIIPGPRVPSYGYMQNTKSKLGGCNDRLRYFGWGIGTGYVWELDDYNTGKWSLVQEICFDQREIEGSRIISKYDLTPLAIHPFDENIVFLRERDEVIWYHMRLKKGKTFCSRDGCEIYPIELPCWPVSLPKR